MNRIDKMTKSVVRITTEKSIGTGFFFVFQIDKSDYPFIITKMLTIPLMVFLKLELT